MNNLIVPVRPSLKSRYPLVPMEAYIRWQNDQGLPFDPWLRVHVRNGGRIVKVCPLAMRIEGSISDWEGWTGMRFPESFDYFVPGALNPVEMNVETDRGLYLEPNVWIDHPSGMLFRRSVWATMRALADVLQVFRSRTLVPTAEADRRVS